MLISRLGVQVPLGAPRTSQELHVPPFRAALFIFADRSSPVAVARKRPTACTFALSPSKRYEPFSCSISLTALYTTIYSYLSQRGAQNRPHDFSRTFASIKQQSVVEQVREATETTRRERRADEEHVRRQTRRSPAPSTRNTHRIDTSRRRAASTRAQERLLSPAR